ncbi:MAG: hypothetical protein REI94_09610 [Moraxellaceae bacterium]|nr:hypothetical protein [Moraxellaceae bacterium]
MAFFRSRSFALSRLLAFVLAFFYVWTASATQLSMSHVPLSASCAEVVVAHDDHGHTHGEIVCDGADNGFQPKHHATDHSHDAPTLLPVVEFHAQSTLPSWQPTTLWSVLPAPQFTLERPPKAG